MGFLKKIFKPVSKVLDKIVPNEIKPLLPYAAAFAPMFAPGIMGTFGNSMMSRALMSGGLNLGSQLAQEGSEGDFNPLSVAMASGIGALSAPGKAATQGLDKFGSIEVPYSTAGTPSAGEYLKGLSDSGSFGDKGLEFLGKGADKLSALNAAGVADPFSMAGLKAAVLPVAQATGDLAYADAQRALRDYENSEGGGSGYAEGDQNRGLAIRRAMERGGHEEQTIQDMLESLGYEDPDPQPLANGGRVGLREGGLSMLGQMDLLGNNQSQITHMGPQPGLGGGRPFPGMGGGNNSPIFPRLDELQSGVSKAENSLQDINGRLGAPNGGLQSVRPGLMGLYRNNPAVAQPAVDTSMMNRAVPAANGGIMSNQRMNFAGGGMDASRPDFNDMPKVLENVKTAQVEEVSEIVELDDLSKIDSFAEMLSNIDESDPKYNEIKNMAIQEAEMVGEKYQIDPVNLIGYFDKKTDMFKEKSIDDGKKEMLMESIKNTSFGFADGGVTSVLPQGMEMDYRSGGFIPMGSKERADDVPARVSKNEFVMTADAVRAAGGGSVNEGARRMYNLMNNLEAKA